MLEAQQQLEEALWLRGEAEDEYLNVRHPSLGSKYVSLLLLNEMDIH